MLRRLISASFFLAFFSSAAPAQVTIAPARLPEAGLGINYYVELHASGGTAPYKWKIGIPLPAGLTFDLPTGTLTGIPEKAGDYPIVVAVTDASGHSASRRYALHVTLGDTVTVAWTKPPAVANGGISGELEVTNPGRETFDVTVIVVAVNEMGRATALGYQRFSLAPGKQGIPFGSTLPRGRYVVHADAVGEIAPTRTIRRARLQTNALSVP